jgi:hypothetical protein
MLILSIHLNNLVTWAIAVFSVSLMSERLNSEEPIRYYVGMTLVDAVLSCISGFYIASYLIKKLEEALSSQVFKVFNEGNDSRKQE